MARCKLTRMSLRNIRKDKQYQCIVIDFVRAGVISKSKAEELLNYTIPAGLLEGSVVAPDDDDEPGTGDNPGTGDDPGTGDNPGTGETATVTVYKEYFAGKNSEWNTLCTIEVPVNSTLSAVLATTVPGENANLQTVINACTTGPWALYTETENDNVVPGYAAPVADESLAGMDYVITGNTSFYIAGVAGDTPGTGETATVTFYEPIYDNWEVFQAIDVPVNSTLGDVLAMPMPGSNVDIQTSIEAKMGNEGDYAFYTEINESTSEVVFESMVNTDTLITGNTAIYIGAAPEVAPVNPGTVVDPKQPVVNPGN